MVNARFLVKKKNAKLVFRVAARLRAASGVAAPFFFASPTDVRSHGALSSHDADGS